MHRLSIILFLLLCSMAQLSAQPCRSVGNLIQSVSVHPNPLDGSAQTHIIWNTPLDLSFVDGYIIYEYVGESKGCTNPIDTVKNPAATTCIVNGFHPGGYTIAVDSSSTRDNGLLQQYHVPPIIQTADYDPCNYTVSLSWSPYVGWDEGDALYNVYAIVDGQLPPQPLLDKPTTTTSWVWQDAPDNKEIDFYVEAVRKNEAAVTSNSPYRRITTTTLQRPASINLSHLEYAGNEVRLNFHIDPNTALTQFEIQRAAGAGFDTRHAFSDKTLATYAESANGVFSYRLVAKNNCGQIARVSDTLQNFILDVSLQNNVWQLQWNPPAPGASYDFSLQRLEPNPAVLATSISGVTFTDPVSFMQNQQSLKYCYRLEGTAPRGLSTSEACAFYVPRVAMPDAVDPLSAVQNAQTGRARNQFGPILNVHPATYAYQLRIINRNGAKIADITKGFNDDPLDKSWNGRFANGVAVPEEVYTYYLEVQFEGGRSEKRTGPVMVVYE